jgi:hypothetical protein
MMADVASKHAQAEAALAYLEEKMNRIKRVGIAFALAILSVFGLSLYANESGKMSKDMAKDMPAAQCARMGGSMGGPMGGPMCGHGGKCGHGGASQSLVATTDGGVVVLCGNHLIKFDKNLKQISDVELKCSCCPKMGMVDGKGAPEQCPWHSKDMKKSSEKKDQNKASDGGKAAPAKP